MKWEGILYKEVCPCADCHKVPQKAYGHLASRRRRELEWYFFRYMVTKDVWLQVFGQFKGILCLACLAKRLNRKMTLDDFPAKQPINKNKTYRQYLVEYANSGRTDDPAL